jgi:hypothetical protein
MHSSDFSGFIEITPPLSKEERDYINAFKSTPRVDCLQGPYFVTKMNPASAIKVRHHDIPAYGQPSLRCQWEITEDGSRIVFDRIVFDEGEHEFDKPLEWMVYLIDHFLRLKPFIMEEFPQVLREYGIPNFSGHICNGHIQCRKHHNIIVENNRVGKELSWPNGRIEWLNEPEPVFEAMQDYRDRVLEDAFDPTKLFCGGLGRKRHMIDPVLLQETYAKANEVDGWPQDQDVKEITREDVEILKSNWEADPIWDLETTEGFEAYRDELKAFSEAKEAEWVAERERRERKELADLAEKAAELGCSVGVMRYISRLEGRIKHLEKEVSLLLEQSDAASRKTIHGIF